jgi:acyl-coenzyme A synthetase/AMP-(fatty) acid ligase
MRVLRRRGLERTGVGRVPEKAKIFRDKIPVIDHMWQTETSGPMFGNPYGLGMLPIKPGSATIATPGIDAAVTLDGNPCGVLKAVIQGHNPSDITTIEDEGSVEEAKRAWQQMKAELGAQTATADQGEVPSKRRAAGVTSTNWLNERDSGDA